MPVPVVCMSLALDRHRGIRPAPIVRCSRFGNGTQSVMFSLVHRYRLYLSLLPRYAMTSCAVVAQPPRCPRTGPPGEAESARQPCHVHPLGLALPAYHPPPHRGHPPAAELCHNWLDGVCSAYVSSLAVGGPSPGIMRQYERKSDQRQSHVGHCGLLKVRCSADRSPASFILLHASFVLLYKAPCKGEPIRKGVVHISGGFDIGY